MTKYNLILSEKAELQIEKAFLYYDLISIKIADNFIFEVEICLNSITENPLLFQIQKNYFRQALISNFPFVVVYSIEKQDVILVNSVFHTSQNPKKKYK